jgi:hypothetical protein
MNVLKISVNNPEELLNPTSSYGPGAVIHVERSATGGGTGFAEIGTVAIVAGTTIYTYYDQSALAGSWYRTFYRDATAVRPPSQYSDESQATSYLTNYCSIYDVKQALGLLPSDTTNDEELLQHIDQVAGLIESRTHRALYQDPVTTYTFDGYSALAQRRCLPIPRGVVSLSALSYATTTGGSLTTLAAGSYVLRPGAGDREPGWPATQVWLTDSAAIGSFPQGYDNISLTGVFGWPSVPREVAALARRLTIAAWRARSAGSGDSVTIGVMGERTYENMLSWSERQTLASYDAAVLVA